MNPARYTSAEPQHWPQLSAALPTILSGPWDQEALSAMVTAGHVLRVLISDGEVSAFVEAQWVVDECQLFNIAVLPKWQRQGLGMLLLQAFLRESRTAGMTSCVLEVRESNVAARRLYEKCGFTRSGIRPGYYPSRPESNEREAALLYYCSL